MNRTQVRNTLGIWHSSLSQLWEKHVLVFTRSVPLSKVHCGKEAYIVRAICTSVLKLVSQIGLGRVEHGTVESMNCEARREFAERIIER